MPNATPNATPNAINITLPPELIIKIFSFCDRDLLDGIQKHTLWEDYKREIKRMVLNIDRSYWKQIHGQHFERLMKHMIERHQIKMFFGEGGIFVVNKMTPLRRAFLDDWFESDLIFYGKIYQKNTDFLLSFLKKERERINEKYNFQFQDLDIRLLVFNNFPPF